MRYDFALIEYGEFDADYYTGKTYIVNNECYPGRTSKKEEAKKYRSKGTAENARNKLNQKTGRNFVVLELNNTK